jgi:hypothetical protein
MHTLQCRNAAKEEDSHYFAIHCADVSGTCTGAFVACPECGHVFPYPRNEVGCQSLVQSHEIVQFVRVTLLCAEHQCAVPVSFYMPRTAGDTRQTLSIRMSMLVFHVFCSREHLLELRDSESQLASIEDAQPFDFCRNPPLAHVCGPAV